MTTTLDDTTTPTVDAPDAAHTNLWLALLAFQQEMPTVAKTKTARVPTKTGGSYSYSYADLAVIAATATPILARHGLMFVSTTGQVKNGNGYELVGHVIHAATGQEVSGALPLFGTNAQDIGGSITYMRRYLMGCLTGIITDDDTDAVEAPAQRAQQQDPHRPPAQRMTQQQFDALVQWQESGVNLTTVFWDVLKRAASSDDMTFDEAAQVLEYLHKREEERNRKS
jgi:ERF superfamily protein